MNVSLNVIIAVSLDKYNPIVIPVSELYLCTNNGRLELLFKKKLFFAYSIRDIIISLFISNFAKTSKKAF